MLGAVGVLLPATALLHACGTAAGVMLTALSLQQAARVAGALIVVVGIYLTVA